MKIIFTSQQENVLILLKYQIDYNIYLLFLQHVLMYKIVNNERGNGGKIYNDDIINIVNW